MNTIIPTKAVNLSNIEANNRKPNYESFSQKVMRFHHSLLVRFGEIAKFYLIKETI